MIFNITSGKKWIYDQVTVTIKGNTSTSTYDGASHSASGYTVTITGSSTYSTSDFSFSGSASASRTAAGTTNMGLAVSQFTNTNPMYRSVTFVVTDGYVKINQKAVTVKADDKSKTYGASDPTLTATITGRVSTSDTITYSLSRASGSNVGTYTITASGAASQGNYTVSFSNGTFTINKAAASALGLSVSGGTYTYNGTARSISASVSVTSGTTIFYSSNGSSGWTTTKPTLTNAGSITTYVKAVNSNYNDATGNATVTINKAAASALGLSVSGYSALYNGSAHSITASVSVTSGTTIYYSSNGSSGWTTTKPTLTNVGTITTYVKAVNANYNDATGNATVSNKCRITVTTTPSATVKFGTSATVTANSSGVATYDTAVTGSWTITCSKTGFPDKSGTVTVPTNSASAAITLTLIKYLYHDGTADVAWTFGTGSYKTGYMQVAQGRTTSSLDLTPYSTLTVQYIFAQYSYTYKEYVGYSTSFPSSWSQSSYEGKVEMTYSASKNTVTLNIASVTGAKYIGFMNEFYADVYQVYLT